MVCLDNEEKERMQELFNKFITGKGRTFAPLMEGMFGVFSSHKEGFKSEISKLETLEYSKDAFGCYYPFLIDITNMDAKQTADAVESVNGVNRYLKQSFIYDDRSFLVCKEFYLEKGRGALKKSLYQWFCDYCGIEISAELETDVTNKPQQNMALTQNDDIDKKEPIIRNSNIITIGSTKKYSKEFLEEILDKTTPILLRPEIDSLRKLIRLYDEDKAVSEKELNDADRIINRLKLCKEILLSIDLK